MKDELVLYGRFLDDIKTRIRQAQTRAVLSVNAEMILMYWDIGRMVNSKQEQEGWGKAVIPRLSRDISNDLPDVKGFSERNIGRMVRFYREYPGLSEFLPEPVAKNQKHPHEEKVPEPLANMPDNAVEEYVLRNILSIPWTHNILLFEKCQDKSIRSFYIEQILAQGWSSNVLSIMIGSNAHKRQGRVVSNFQTNLPDPQSDLVQQSLKDPYIFDFLTLSEPFRETELESELIEHLQNFLVELGQGFAFVGRQYHLVIGEDDFYIDLLFYNLNLRCFIVIELKKGDFKPEYAGKVNFYCSAVDDLLRNKTDNPTIGLILCQNKNQIVAEYTLRGIRKPIGISEFELTRSLPDDLKSSLPSIEEIEAELSGDMNDVKKGE